MLRAVFIVIAFLVVSYLMIRKIVPTILALPILAIAIAVIAGIPFNGDDGIMRKVIDGGITRMYASAFVAIIGAWLGEVMVQSGISKRIIRFAAELGGDNPYAVLGSLSFATALIFTSFGGLGGTIMVGTITIPIMMSFGLPALSSACLMLLSMATGIAINVGNWVVYADATGVSVDVVKQFTFILAGLTAVAAIVFMVVEVRKIGVVKQWAVATEAPQEEETKVPLLALVTPIIPIVLVMGFKWPVSPSIIVAILYATLTLWKAPKDSVNFLSKTAVDGSKLAGPAILLLIGIGMLLNSVMHPAVTAVMNPLLSAIIPSGGIGYILFFVLLAPLALYRGPLNLWGLGSGILAMIVSLSLLSPELGMGALLATERVQAIADPTNSFTVWISNFANVPVNDIMKKVLPYAWVVTAIGVVISSLLFM